MQPVTHYPLLGIRDRGSVLVWHKRAGITAGRFLAQARALAERLPDHAYAINLCESPYLFLLSFTAVLLRGQTNVLPPNRLPGTVGGIAREYGDCHLLTDSDLEPQAVSDIPLPRYAVTIPAVSDDQDIDVSLPMIDAGHIAAILFTSGSTGQTQPYPKPWRTLVLGATANAKASIPLGSYPALAGTVPAQHSYGLETLVMLPLQGHCSVYSERPFFPQDIAHALHDLPAPRVLVTTPVHLRALTEAKPELPALQAIWSATAPLSSALAACSEQQFETRLHEIFGCTEAGTFATRRTVRDDDWQLLEEFTLQVSDDASGALITAAHLPASPRLQDQITQADPRHFKLLGRGADLINIAGKRASLADLNNRLLDIPGVLDGIMFMPDSANEADQETLEQDAVIRTAALVVAPTLSREQILAALHQRIDAAFLPRPLYLVDRLPRNDVAKLPRAAILKLFAELKHASAG